MKKIVLVAYILITIFLLVGLTLTYQNRIFAENRAQQIIAQAIERPRIVISGLQFEPTEINTHKGAIVTIIDKDLVGYDVVISGNHSEFHLDAGDKNKVIFEESGLYEIILKAFPYVKATIVVE